MPNALTAFLSNPKTLAWAQALMATESNILPIVVHNPNSTTSQVLGIFLVAEEGIVNFLSNLQTKAVASTATISVQQTAINPTPPVPKP